MEEASIAAVNGELSPFTTGVTACRMIGACRDLTDYRRASEWIEATEKYCDRQSLSGFPGVCRIHRAEVAAVGGAWEQRRAGARTRNDRARRVQRDAAAGRRVLRDRRHPPAAGATSRAPRRPCARPTPAAGRRNRPSPSSASPRARSRRRRGAINAAVAEETWDRWARARLLPAQVEIAIAAGDVAGARTAIDALTEIVAGYPSPALEAGRQVALGRVLARRRRRRGRDPRAARRDQGLARRRCAVRGRAGPGGAVERAIARSTTTTTADLELDAALDEFRRLGARIDIEAAERELRDVEDRRTGPVSAARRSCSPTSSARRASPRPSATGLGAPAAAARRH